MIFLIHGTKAARKRLGYVADFCPVCQSLSRFVLQLFNPMVERRYSRRFDFDRPSCGGCLGTLVLVVFLFQRSCAAGHDRQSWFLGALWALLAGFFCTLLLAATGPRRYLRAVIVPGVLHGMDVIHAETGEMHAALHRARSLGLKIGRTLKPAMLDVPGAPHNIR